MFFYKALIKISIVFESTSTYTNFGDISGFKIVWKYKNISQISRVLIVGYESSFFFYL